MTVKNQLWLGLSFNLFLVRFQHFYALNHWNVPFLFESMGAEKDSWITDWSKQLATWSSMLSLFILPIYIIDYSYATLVDVPQYVTVCNTVSECLWHIVFVIGCDRTVKIHKVRQKVPSALTGGSDMQVKFMTDRANRCAGDLWGHHREHLLLCLVDNGHIVSVVLIMEQLLKPCFCKRFNSYTKCHTMREGMGTWR